jgi:hypothetical protein
LIALLFSAAVAAYPAPAQAALAIDDAAGLVAFLNAAGTHARSLSADEVGRQLREQVGLDPLTLKGPRTLVFAQHAVGMIATLDAAKARAALATWKRPTRIGVVTKGKLYTASGRDAQALLKALQKPKPLEKRLQTKGPVSLWFALAPPLQFAGFSLNASAQGLTVTGLVTAAKPILQGSAPARCDGVKMGCLSASLGPAGIELLMHTLVKAGQPTPREAPETARFASRLDGIDPFALTSERSVPRALHYAFAMEAPGIADGQCKTTPGGIFALSNPPCAPPVPLEPAGEASADGSLDLAQVDQALSKLSALDALNGEAAAGAYAVHLLYGALLRHLGPLTLHAEPARNAAAAAELSLHLPLH